jgi:hypothetical protein
MIHFYAFHKQQLLIISDHAKDKITDKYGPVFEIVNSIKDKESLEIIKPKITRQFSKYQIVEYFYSKKLFSEETKKKMSLAKMNKPRADWIKEKISLKMKGKSNFEGKKHRRESRIKTSLSMMNNTNITEDHKFIYNPNLEKELRVKDIINIPAGYRKGRDQDSTDPMRNTRTLL